MIFCDIALLTGARDFGDGQCEDAFFYKRLDVVCRNVFYIGLTEKDSEKLRKTPKNSKNFSFVDFDKRALLERIRALKNFLLRGTKL